MDRESLEEQLDDLLALQRNELAQLLARSNKLDYSKLFERLDAHKLELDKAAVAAMKSNVPAQGSLSINITNRSAEQNAPHQTGTIPTKRESTLVPTHPRPLLLIITTILTPCRWLQAVTVVPRCIAALRIRKILSTLTIPSIFRTFSTLSTVTITSAPLLNP